MAVIADDCHFLFTDITGNIPFLTLNVNSDIILVCLVLDNENMHVGFTVLHVLLDNGSQISFQSYQVYKIKVTCFQLIIKF